MAEHLNLDSNDWIGSDTQIIDQLSTHKETRSVSEDSKDRIANGTAVGDFSNSDA